MKSSIPLRWSHGFIGVMLTFLVFGLSLTSMITTQYIDYYLETHMFPNSSDPDTGDISTCSLNKSTIKYRELTDSEKAASELDIYASVSETGPALITLGIMGVLSDRFRRNKILVINLLFCLSALCLSSAIIYFDMNVYYFLVSGTLYSLGGGLFGALSLGFAYISDITNSGKQRSMLITLLEALVGIGGALSYVASGYLIENIGFLYANLCACAAAFTSVSIVVLFLPNSLPSHGDIPHETFSEHMSASFSFYFKPSPKRYKYILTMLLFLVASLSTLGRTVEILYQKNVPFCWSPVNEGYFAAISLASKLVVGVTIMKFLQICLVNEVIAILGGISSMISSIVEAFATDDATLFVVPVIGCLSFLVLPIVRAVMSQLTPSNKQGALFAGIEVIEIAANLGSNAGASFIYMATVDTLRGFVFLVFAGLSFLTIVLLVIYRLTAGGARTVPIPDTTKEINCTQVVADG